MNVRCVALATLLIFGGCASLPSTSVPVAHTLAGDRRLPVGDIQRQFAPAQWQKLSALEYDAFVLFDAQIRDDGSLRIGKVRESYPDASWHELARTLGEEAKLRAATVGSHIDPTAKVVVIFFKQALDGNLALIVAEQNNEPGPGMTQKAIYIRARRY